jgi:hypothetical protein
VYSTVWILIWWTSLVVSTLRFSGRYYDGSGETLSSAS